MDCFIAALLAVMAASRLILDSDQQRDADHDQRDAAEFATR
jgi:hypothetical protein